MVRLDCSQKESQRSADEELFTMRMMSRHWCVVSIDNIFRRCIIDIGLFKTAQKSNAVERLQAIARRGKFSRRDVNENIGVHFKIPSELLFTVRRPSAASC